MLNIEKQTFANKENISHGGDLNISVNALFRIRIFRIESKIIYVLCDKIYTFRTDHLQIVLSFNVAKNRMLERRD